MGRNVGPAVVGGCLLCGGNPPQGAFKGACHRWTCYLVMGTSQPRTTRKQENNTPPPLTRGSGHGPPTPAPARSDHRSLCDACARSRCRGDRSCARACCADVVLVRPLEFADGTGGFEHSRRLADVRRDEFRWCELRQPRSHGSGARPDARLLHDHDRRHGLRLPGAVHRVHAQRAQGCAAPDGRSLPRLRLHAEGHRLQHQLRVRVRAARLVRDRT